MHIRAITSDIDAIDAYPAFITRDYFIKNFGVINDPTRSSTSVKSLGHLRVKLPSRDNLLLLNSLGDMCSEAAGKGLTTGSNAAAYTMQCVAFHFKYLIVIS